MSVQADTDADTTGEGFAERWSRRKQEVGREHAEQAVQTGSPDTEAATEAAPELTDDDMPPVESLDEHSDYAAFLSPGISEYLRAQALRKLFQLPGMHLPDGLDDYDDDFTQFKKLGNTITHEMQRMLKRELQAVEASEDTETQMETQAVVEAETPPGDCPVEDEQPTTVSTTPGDEDRSERQSG